ncbi:MAG: hypothetical protein ABFS42_12130 [Candidatus Krumholzibacteriota bacterium]
MTETPRQSVTIRRDVHLFASRPQLVEKLKPAGRRILLAPDQLLHPEPATAYIVRLGKLRVTQFLPKGAEVTRAVLQAGSLLKVEDISRVEADPAADVYYLSEMVFMALGEAKLWALPITALNEGLKKG